MSMIKALRGVLVFNGYRLKTKLRSPLVKDELAEKGPVNVLGFFTLSTGLGRSATILADMLEQLGYRVVRIDVAPLFARAPWNFKSKLADLSNKGPIICVINPPEIPIVLDYYAAQLKSRRRIGYWVYETEDIPPSWAKVFPLVHEVWVPTEFVRKAVKKTSPNCEVFSVPHMPKNILGKRSNLDERDPPRPLTILNMFDMRSSFVRKNPLGVVESYRQAFLRDDQAQLILKVNNSSSDEKAYAQLLDAVYSRRDIHLLTESLPYEQVMELVRQCDIYISLHRSEGFGLTLMEAMHAAKPVIATGWSGNMDFMTQNASVLIPFNKVKVKNAGSAYRRGEWASPDLTAATEALKTLANDKDLRRHIGLAGQARAREFCSLERISGLIGSRLDHLTFRKSV